MNRWTPARAIAVATLIAGALDLALATLLSGVGLMRVLHSVAGAILGRDAAMDGGIATAIVGLALHFAIMTVMASVFMLVVMRTAFARRHPVAAGALYGVLLYVVMYLIVLPLRYPAIFPRFSLAETGGQLFSHVVLVGMTMGLVGRKLRAG